ncbi:hypothetical protein Bbelb_256430 [Branchiostoma belcheri]|nr:hypothetical protein Bbelb_256430 [Branchiostoma belcheri]
MALCVLSASEGTTSGTSMSATAARETCTGTDLYLRTPWYRYLYLMLRVVRFPCEALMQLTGLPAPFLTYFFRYPREYDEVGCPVSEKDGFAAVGEVFSLSLPTKTPIC